MSFVSVALGAGVGSMTAAPIGIGAGLGSFALRNIFGGRQQPVAQGQGFNPIGMAAGGNQYGNQTSNMSLPSGFDYNPWTQNYQNSQGTSFMGQSASDNNGDNVADFSFLKQGETSPAPSSYSPQPQAFTPGPNTTAVPKGTNPGSIFGAASMGLAPILARSMF